MDGPRFDALTRRGVGLAAGGFSAALLALSGIAGAGARKRKKKKCRKLGQKCEGSGDKKCCCPLSCASPVDSTGEFKCCFQNGEPCTAATGSKCCSGFCTITGQNTQGFCLCKTNGQTCSEDHQCCSGACVGTTVKLCAPPD